MRQTLLRRSDILRPSGACRSSPTPRWPSRPGGAFVFGETFKAACTDAQKAFDAILGYARKRPIVKARQALLSGGVVSINLAPGTRR